MRRSRPGRRLIIKWGSREVPDRYAQAFWFPFPPGSSAEEGQSVKAR
jgi:hypothetical protein